jgi:hypothetical protein
MMSRVVSEPVAKFYGPTRMARVMSDEERHIVCGVVDVLLCY